MPWSIVFKQVRHAVRGRIPVAVVNNLAEDELVARGVGRLVVNLLVVEEPPVLILGQAVRDDVADPSLSASFWS